MEYRSDCNLPVLPRDVTELGTVSCLRLSLEIIRFIPSCKYWRMPNDWGCRKGQMYVLMLFISSEILDKHKITKFPCASLRHINQGYWLDQQN